MTATTTRSIDLNDTVVTWTPEARQTYVDMYNRVSGLKVFFGPESKQAREAQDSLAHVTVALLRWNTLRVMKDGELSLLCSSGNYVFGVIFFAEKRRCLNEGCRALMDDNGSIWTYNHDDPRCDDHRWSHPLHAPTPGTWSIHS